MHLTPRQENLPSSDQSLPPFGGHLQVWIGCAGSGQGFGLTVLERYHGSVAGIPSSVLPLGNHLLTLANAVSNLWVIDIQKFVRDVVDVCRFAFAGSWVGVLAFAGSFMLRLFGRAGRRLSLVALLGIIVLVHITLAILVGVMGLGMMVRRDAVRFAAWRRQGRCSGGHLLFQANGC